jgi:predicted Rossmann fold flavoprotein
MSGRILIVGGGAAGFFGAIACAANAPGAEVVILEKTAQVLQKVRISGGGRCNVTHACFDARELTRNYPRGEKELIGPYHCFQAEDTVQWFESRGVKLKTERDGRMFPVTDSSETIVRCLQAEAQKLGIQVRLNSSVATIRKESSRFSANDASFDRVLLATGGCRTPALGQLAVSLGHKLVPPVPSLFTFSIASNWLRELAGLTVGQVELRVPEKRLMSSGPLLVTHWGLSGPAVLRLSAWGARELSEVNYNFTLRVNWIPGLDYAAIEKHARANGGKLVANAPIPPLPARLWQALLEQAGVGRERRWSNVSREEQNHLFDGLTATELPVTGKSLNKDEFVTCGGVALHEVHFKNMESKLCPGLYFAGELLDIDGITGGFNFQAAWTTGWIAGRSIAASLSSS